MFWDRFYALCKDRNESPTQVVIALGISHGAPTKWKQGKIPTGETLMKLSEYFDVSVDYLLGKTDIKKRTVPSEQPLTPLQNEFLNLILSLSDSELDLTRRFLSALHDSKSEEKPDNE